MSEVQDSGNILNFGRFHWEYELCSRGGVFISISELISIVAAVDCPTQKKLHFLPFPYYTKQQTSLQLAIAVVQPMEKTCLNKP